MTYNDSPSGIYSSQVIDVVKFLNAEFKTSVKLVAFISLRHFFKNRAKIKNELPETLVIPMFPGIHRWRLNKIQLSWIARKYKPQTIICRSVLATHLGFDLQKRNLVEKVVYDGRGAISAEWKEYDVVSHPAMLKEIFHLEKEAILNSDYRIAVSNQLVEYWQTEFDYHLEKHVVIPCTVNKVFEQIELSDSFHYKSRQELGLKQDDVVFIYAGSVAGWQSFKLLYNFIQPLLRSGGKYKMVFFSDMDENITKLQHDFPDQVICKKVKPNEVPSYLIVGDYGLLIREQSITNKVASPVKFAEYLACGLKVIISKNLGDYSDFVKNNNCGYLFDQFKIEHNDRFRLNEIATKNYTKSFYKSYYKKILN